MWMVHIFTKSFKRAKMFVNHVIQCTKFGSEIKETGRSINAE